MRQLLIISCLLILLGSCKKETFNYSPDARIVISDDSLRFDTVFTRIGSITKTFKIKNDDEGRIKLSSVSLMGGNNSTYRININGLAATEANDIEIPANDSIYVFVSVYIDPGSNNLPFLVQDSIRIAYNGIQKFVQLQAYGQNAHYLRDSIIKTNQTWTNDLPYVILGGLKVDSNTMLTIDAGCKLYFHANAAMTVNGSLRANGTANNRVIFTGDRLDSYYRDLPGSWPGIFFSESSSNNSFLYTTIKNSYEAITAVYFSGSGTKLQLHQCIIDNAFEAGIVAVNSSIDADNCLISNCRKNIRILQGGNYHFTHCTIAGYSTNYVTHQFPVAFIADAASVNGNIITAPLQASFTNCIFWGDGGFVNDEIITDKKGNNFSLMLDHCIFKAETDPANTNFASIIRNNDPRFDSIDAENNYFDFHTREDINAPGIDRGISTAFLLDLDGMSRNIGNPDIGCYEKQ